MLDLREEVRIFDAACGTLTDLALGDPADHANGTFAQHIKAKVGTHLKIGDNVSFEDAATLGVGITTVAQGLYQELGLPLLPEKVKEPTPILIYGASTATGTLAIQYAKLSGAEVYATSSPHNFDLIRKLGADHVFDYKDSEVGAKIRKATNDKLKLVFDCISEGNSPEITAAAVSSAGGHVSGLLPVKVSPHSSGEYVSLVLISHSNFIGLSSQRCKVQVHLRIHRSRRGIPGEHTGEPD